MSTYTHIDSTCRATSALATTVAAILLLALGACVSRPPAPDLQFADGWREHSRPLVYHGLSREPGVTDWLVPTILPNETYLLFYTVNDKLVSLDGYRIEFTDNPWAETHVRLPSAYGGIVAVEEHYVIELPPVAPPAPAGR